MQGADSDLHLKLRSRDEELQSIGQELDYFKQQTQTQMDNSSELKTEIEALNRHMSLLNQQNFELSTELEKFIETDEVVRRSLNRKGKVEDIRHKVDEAIQKSMIEVQSRKSPERRQRESPLKGSRR